MNNKKSHNLPTEELHKLLEEWNNSRTDYPSDSSVHQLFEEQVKSSPESVAVVFGEKRMSYRELNCRANQLARHLLRHSVGANVLVGICMERSVEMIIGILGVLKAGGAYVPLDPEYPDERLAFMLEDAGAPVLLTHQRLADNLPEVKAKVICLDRDWTSIADEKIDDVSGSATAMDPAYVIYTSGSTGIPKGVTVPHRAIIRLVINTNYIPLIPSDRMAQASNSSFDAATFEIWGALLHGAQLILIPREIVLNSVKFAQHLRHQKITVLFLTTALFNQLSRQVPGAFSGLRYLLFGGETVDPTCVRRVLIDKPPHHLLHMYGPTESTTFATWYRVRNVDGDATTVPIGKPVSNTRIYLLDRHLKPVPVGTPGEIYIGGEGLALGYWNRPELTAEKFIPNPFGDRSEMRLYRTGDLGRYCMDGSIEFLSRIDYQVKIRGLRIELGEIETAISQHPAVREVVVLAREDESGEKRLVGYLTPLPDQRLMIGELRRFLRKKLPDYMIPSSIILLDALPLTPNGKVDRSALPAPGNERPELEENFVPPRTPVEEMVAEIWAEILNLKRIGVLDNFLDLGGHSLIATRIVSQVRDVFNVELSLNSIFETPTVAGMTEKIEKSRSEKGSSDIPSFQPIARDADIPLSFSQERVWFIQQLNPSSIAYNFQATFRFTGFLNTTVLEKSLSEIVRRHEIFRTTFPDREGRAIQVIHEARTVHLPIMNLNDGPESDREAKAQQLIYEEFQKPFDLTQLPLIRWSLFRLSEHDHILTQVEHHLIHDGWSFNVFLNELLELYKAYSSGNPSPLPDLPVQFADFAYWQRKWMQGETSEKQLAYWKKKLTGSPPELKLPYDYPRPAVQTFRGTSLRVELPQDLCESLRAMSRREASTLFMTMQTAFVTLLHRYSGQEDICVGAGIANRRWCETEGMIGMIINNVVLRTDLSGNPTFRELLEQMRTVTLEAYEYQDVPFDKVVDALQPRRDMSRNPLFQVMFGFHDSPLPALELPELEIDILEGLSNESAKFDMTVVVIPRAEQRVGLSHKTDGEGITILWEYNTDLFDKGTITRMVEHYQTLLRGVAANPEQHISAVPLLSESERHMMLAEWNATGTNYPRGSCIHELFEDQADRTPDAVAAVFGKQSMTYDELNCRANQMANHLRKLGVGPDVPVGICMERSIELLVGLIGILKAGGAYVPLDPEYPKDRLTFMLEDTRAPVLLTRDRFVEDLPLYGVTVVLLDSIAHESSANIPHDTTADNLAYVMYTSGSTGRPKGICVPHRGVVRLVKETDYVHLTAEETFLQFAPVSFDASTFEIWGSLLNGARLVVFPSSTPSLEELGRVLKHYSITTLWLTAGLFHQMVEGHTESLKNVRQLFAGGDVLSVSHVKKFLEMAVGSRLVNGYGPTENTTFTCCYPMKELNPLHMSVPIGRPIANTEVYVLDRHFQPVPIGVPGELFIGGDGLSRNYLKRPELTAEKFMPNPFSDVPGARLYKTGDLVSYRSDGNIDFLGRRDLQVKVRGFRIEPAEIEVVLCSHPAVSAAVVLVRDDVSGDKRLVSYVVTDQNQTPSRNELRSYLREKLPDYMVPSVFVFMDRIPLTPNGKVDRNALPVPDRVRPAIEGRFIAPRTQTEEALAEIWCEILGVEKVGINDNFFELGGHSLLATQIISRLRDTLRIELPMHKFFETLTIAGLSESIEKIMKNNSQLNSPAIAPLSRQSRRANVVKEPPE